MDTEGSGAITNVVQVCLERPMEGIKVFLIDVTHVLLLRTVTLKNKSKNLAYFVCVSY